MLLDLAWSLTRPALFSLDAERAHKLVIHSLGASARLAAPTLSTLAGPPRPDLARQLGPLRIAGPVGLAAGLDKDGLATTVWSSLGFGFVELGTVTALAQPGNPAPRLFRLKPERGLINRMGFNNLGSQALAERLNALRQADRWPDVPVGCNIGKSKVTPLDDDSVAADYLLSVQRLRGVADYFTVNVSSPNTPGLRSLQAVGPLARLVSTVVPAARDVPVFVKVAPDFETDDLAAACEAIVGAGAAGIIATNTTLSRPGSCADSDESGGLSGDPLWPLARRQIATVLDVVADRVPVIGVGGVNSAARAQELLDLGCAAVQLYTGMIFEGPGLIGRINAGLR